MHRTTGATLTSDVLEALEIRDSSWLYDQLATEFDAHMSGKHDQRKHGRGRGGGRAGMGDIAITEHWAQEFHGGSAAPHLTKNADGTYSFSPERQALHDQLVNDALAGKTPADNPTYAILGGGPASGKSNLLNSDAGARLRDSNTVIANSDDMKAKLPEYQARIAAGDPTAAPFSHAESSYLNARIQAASFENRLNVTLDGTGDSAPAKLRGKIQTARNSGYRVEGHYVTVDTDIAVARAQSRAERTGRHVPETYLRDTHVQVSRTATETYTDFDAFELYDTTSGSTGGLPMTHVMSYTGGQTTIHDPAGWDRFVAKGAG